MLEVQRKYIHNYGNDVEAYFIRSSYDHNEEIFLDGDMFHVRGKEDFFTILHKTLMVMEYLKNHCKKEYDFTLRTNISTVVDINKLMSYLKNFREVEYIYGGDLGIDTTKGFTYYYALGTAIIFSRKVYDPIVENMSWAFDHSVWDDQAFGIYIAKFLPSALNHDLYIKPYGGVNGLILYSRQTPAGENTSLQNFIEFSETSNLRDLSVLFYRNRTLNSLEDVKIMDCICNHLLSSNNVVNSQNYSI